MVLDNILDGGRNFGEVQEEGALVVAKRTLEANSHYSFYVVVTNEVGAVESRPIQISK